MVDNIACCDEMEVVYPISKAIAIENALDPKIAPTKGRLGPNGSS